MATERHDIVVGDNPPVEQLIFEDKSDTNEISLHATFFWNGNNEDIISADITLTNVNTGINSKWKLHSAKYCKRLDRLEIHITRHRTFNQKKYYLTDVDLKGFSLRVGGEANMWIRTQENQKKYDGPVCSNDPNGTPKDKDGSILVGI